MEIEAIQMAPVRKDQVTGRKLETAAHGKTDPWFGRRIVEGDNPPGGNLEDAEVRRARRPHLPPAKRDGLVATRAS